MKERILAEAARIERRAEKHRLDIKAMGGDGEGELYCYLMGKASGLLDAAAMLDW